jgi:hypothetical protein
MGMMKRRTLVSLYDYLPMRNDIFDSKPKQILALRKCLKWNRADLGAMLGLCINFPRRDCFSVYRWEHGMCRPHPVYRSKLVQIVEMFRQEYLQSLAALRSAASVNPGSD